jgi:DNA-binding XRE family transcriptional regulator
MLMNSLPIFVAEADADRLNSICEILLNEGHVISGRAQSCEQLHDLMIDAQEAVVLTSVFLENNLDVRNEVLAEFSHLGQFQIIYIVETDDQLKDAENFPSYSHFLCKPFSDKKLIFALEQTLLKFHKKFLSVYNLSNILLSSNESSNELSEKIGKEVKRFRITHGISQTDFADRVGISSRQVQRIESGASNMTITLLYLVLKTIDEISQKNVES